MKRLVIPIALILCLVVPVGPAATQGPLSPIPDSRLPITPENAKDLELLATWHSGVVGSVSWVADQRLAVQNPVETLIYDANNLNEPVAIIPATGQSPLLSPDGNWLIFEDEFVLSSGGRFATVWNVQTGVSRQIRFSPAHAQAGLEHPYIVTWASPARLIIASGKELFVLDLNQTDEAAATGRIHPPSEQTNYEIVQLLAAPDGSQFFTLARAFISDQLVLVAWDIETIEPHVLFQSEFLADEYRYQYFDLTPDSPALQIDEDAAEIALLTFHSIGWPATRYEYKLRRWELKSGRELPGYAISDGNWIRGWSLAWGAYFEQEGNNCNLHFFGDQAQVVQLRPWHDSGSRCEIRQLTPGGALFSDTRQDTFYLYLLGGNTQTLVDPTDSMMTTLTLSPDGRYMAARDEEGRLYLWQTDNLNAPVIRDYRTPYVGGRDMALSPDGQKLIFVGLDGAQQFDLLTGERQIIVDEAGSDFWLVTYHPNGDSFVTVDRRGEIRSYDAQDFTLQYTLWDNARPQALGFSRDGQLLAVVSPYAVTIWQMDSLTAINRLNKNRQPRYGDEVVFLENAQWLVYNTHLWRVEALGRLIAERAWDQGDDLPQSVWTCLRSSSVIAIDSAHQLLLSYGHESGFTRLRLKEIATGITLWASDIPPTEAVITKDLIVLGNGNVINFWGVLSKDDES